MITPARPVDMRGRRNIIDGVVEGEEDGEVGEGGAVVEGELVGGEVEGAVLERVRGEMVAGKWTHQPSADAGGPGEGGAGQVPGEGGAGEEVGEGAGEEEGGGEEAEGVEEGEAGEGVGGLGCGGVGFCRSEGRFGVGAVVVWGCGVSGAEGCWRGHFLGEVGIGRERFLVYEELVG